MYCSALGEDVNTETILSAFGEAPLKPELLGLLKATIRLLDGAKPANKDRTEVATTLLISISAYTNLLSALESLMEMAEYEAVA